MCFCFKVNYVLKKVGRERKLTRPSPGLGTLVPFGIDSLQLVAPSNISHRAGLLAMSHLRVFCLFVFWFLVFCLKSLILPSFLKSVFFFSECGILS